MFSMPNSRENMNMLTKFLCYLPGKGCKKMNAYIAYGTKDYLQKVYDLTFKDTKSAFLLASNNEATLIQESDGPNPFNEENTYQIIEEHNTLSHNDFVVINHILTTDEGAPLVENQLKNIVNNKNQDSKGLKAARVYKPVNAEKYILLTAWTSQNEYLLWNNSNAAIDFKKFINAEETAPQSLLEGGSFNKNYFVVS